MAPKWIFLFPISACCLRILSLRKSCLSCPMRPAHPRRRLPVWRPSSSRSIRNSGRKRSVRFSSTLPDGRRRCRRVLEMLKENVPKPRWFAVTDGVPSLERALRSANDALTLVAQATLHPFQGGRMREMHLHRLPWPIEALGEIGGAEVRLRVTLSYFIEPNPGRRGWRHVIAMPRTDCALT